MNGNIEFEITCFMNFENLDGIQYEFAVLPV